MIRKGLVPLGYKKTKIGIIPKDWEVKRLGDIAPLQRGFDLPKYAIEPGKYPVCYSNGVLGYHCAYKVKGPGVFTGRSGTIGNAFYVEKNFWPHNTSLWVTDFKGNHPKYIYYMYDFLNLQRLNAGTSVPTLNRNDVHAYRTAIPSEFEQRQITNIIHKWDTVIELKEKVIGKKKEQKKGLMQNLLTGEIRLPGFDEAYKRATFKEIFYRISSNKHQIKTGSYLENGLYPVIDQGKQKIVAYSNQKNKVLKAGSNGIIVFGDHTREVKYVDFDFVVGADGTQLLKAKEGYDLKYYYYHLLMKRIPDTGYNRHFKFVKEMIFNCPSISEQKAIAEILSTADKEIELLEQELELLRLQKKGLMQLLLTGIVRVKEVAS